MNWAAMFAAVQQSAPSDLLSILQWVYGNETPWQMAGAPEDTPAVMSQGGVRHDDPLDPLLFAIAPQPVLERFAGLHRAAMFAAVQQSAPALLPMVQ